MATLSGGAKLEAYLKDLADQVGEGGAVDVGFLAGATYPDGKPVAMIAAIHNFGKWPFFTQMIAQKRDGWGPALAQNLTAANYDVNVALGRVGEGIKGQLVQAILDTWSPPLAPSTIARKGFDKPLIDTSNMINSANYRVTVR